MAAGLTHCVGVVFDYCPEVFGAVDGLLFAPKAQKRNCAEVVCTISLIRFSFGHNKAVRHFKELEDIGLIERKKQGQGKPTRIYVKNFILPPEPGHSPPSPEAPPQTSQKRKSALPSATQVVGQTSQIGKSALPGAGSQDFPKTNANNTEINNSFTAQAEETVLAEIVYK